MSEIPDVHQRPKPVVIDVKSFKRGNKHKKRKNHQYIDQTNSIEDNFSLPLELRPVINAIVSYGRKTNSLGELGAAKILSDIAINLRKLDLERTNHAIKELIENIERQAENIRLKFENAYNETEQL